MNKLISIISQSQFLLLVLAVAIMGTSGITYAENRVRESRDLHEVAKTVAVKNPVKGNELKAATNAGAALRKSKGLGRTTTNDDRRAAAQRNAARKAAAAKAQGRLP
jgi:hypothetical protein